MFSDYCTTVKWVIFTKYKFLLLSQEDSCLMKFYAIQCSFDCGFYFLNLFVNSNIKRVIDKFVPSASTQGYTLQAKLKFSRGT